MVDFLYVQFTETNSVEDQRVKESYIAFMNELIRQLGYEEADRVESLVNVALAEYEKTAYLEGIKLGARVVMELCGVMEEK